uniref:Uncharacterized protein n=1 Tax=Acrobeloides nanus TaxID=290746 RepID=A0A914DAP7_9BILA
MRVLCILLCLFPYVIPQCNNCVLVVTCYDGSFDSSSSTFYDGILTTTISTDANGCEVITNITCAEEPGYVPTNPEQYQYLYNQDDRLDDHEYFKVYVRLEYIMFYMS